MTDAANVATRVTAAYRRIRDTGMRDIPILNPALDVTTAGFRRWKGTWIGVLVTPWSMNVLRIPLVTGLQAHRATGTASTVNLPAGALEFLACEEPGIGYYEACSLFSPVLQFSEQAAAVATAEAALGMLFDERVARIGPELPDRVVDPPPGISRRALLRGILRNPVA